MIYSNVYNPEISATELNHDLTLINKWAYQWKMEFNPDPTKQAVEVLFSQKIKKVHHPPLKFNGSEVLRVDSHKHLGLILDSNINFINHVNEKIKTTTKTISILKYFNR